MPKHMMKRFSDLTQYAKVSDTEAPAYERKGWTYISKTEWGSARLQSGFADREERSFCVKVRPPLRSR